MKQAGVFNTTHQKSTARVFKKPDLVLMFERQAMTLYLN